MSTQATAAPDGFIFPTDHPRAASHCKLSDYLQDPKNSTLPADSAQFEKPEQLSLLCATLERLDFQKATKKQTNASLTPLVKRLAGRTLPYTEESLVLAASYSANLLMPKDPENPQFDQLDSPIPGVVPALLDGVEAMMKRKPLSKELLEPLRRLHTALVPVKFWAGNKQTVDRLEALVNQKPAGLPDDTEAWAAAIRRCNARRQTQKVAGAAGECAQGHHRQAHGQMAETSGRVAGCRRAGGIRATDRALVRARRLQSF